LFASLEYTVFEKSSLTGVYLLQSMTLKGFVLLGTFTDWKIDLFGSGLPKFLCSIRISLLNQFPIKIYMDSGGY